jgi:CRP-like cAMP-binding protein
MCHIQYFLKACPEGVKLNDFVKQATPYLSYEHFQRGKSIFHFGDAGDRFYIVLKGRVGV